MNCQLCVIGFGVGAGKMQLFQGHGKNENNSFGLKSITQFAQFISKLTDGGTKKVVKLMGLQRSSDVEML